MKRQRCGLAAATVLALCAATVPTGDFDAQGYRATRYRAPVDRPPAPARRIALADALKLEPGHDALFVDVLPVESGHRDPATGQWRLSLAHETVPGALWHPETGRSPVDPGLWRGLVAAVAAARAGRPRLPVVLFCRADCWMGWNAARRLTQGGTRRVYWLAEGIDGWHGAGRALVPAVPVVVPGTGPGPAPAETAKTRPPQANATDGSPLREASAPAGLSAAS
jgi:PQQ-dependent catabolism-associated CXXCW motif protein